LQIIKLILGLDEEVYMIHMVFDDTLSAAKTLKSLSYLFLVTAVDITVISVVSA